jgi:uncharacterized protein (DUF952 family)
MSKVEIARLDAERKAQDVVADSDRRIIYKVCAATEWRDAVATGVYRGSAVDRRDGFIHFSTGDQLAETLRRHFAGQVGLVRIEVEAADLGDGLRWEPSRGGALFPHLYGVLPVTLARRSRRWRRRRGRRLRPARHAPSRGRSR